MERLVTAGNSGLKGVLGPGGAVATDANTVTFTLLGANGNFPYLVSVFNAQTLITPKAYAAGTTLDKVPAGTGRLEAQDLQPADGRDVRAQPGLVGRQDAARRPRVHLLRCDRPDGHRLPGPAGRRDHPVRRPVRQEPAGRRELQPRSSAPAALHRQIWMRTDTGAFADKSVRQALALHVRPPGAHPDAVPGQGPARQRPCDLGGLPLLRLHRSRSGRRTSPRPRRSWPRPACQQPDRDPACRPAARDPRPRDAAQEPGRRRPGSRSTWRSRASTRSMARSGARPSRPIRRAPARPSSASSTTAIAARRTSTSTRRSSRRASGTRRSTARPRSTRRSRTSRRPSASTPRRPPATRSRPILLEDTPIGLPYFYNYLAGSSKGFTGLYASGLGQMFFSAASKTA